MGRLLPSVSTERKMSLRLLLSSLLLLSSRPFTQLKGTLANKSLVTIKDVGSRSIEACCSDNYLTTCQDAEVNSGLIGDQQDISIDGIDLQFKSTVEPNGFVYKNDDGDEAVITINPKTRNMFGSLKTHEGKSYSIEKSQKGYVWKDFDTGSFMPDISEKSSEPEDISRQFVKRPPPLGAEDTTTVVTYSVMIYYTPDFASITPDIEGWVDQVLAETNQGYINSQIPVRITKLCIEQATFNDIDIVDITTFRD